MILPHHWCGSIAQTGIPRRVYHIAGSECGSLSHWLRYRLSSASCSMDYPWLQLAHGANARLYTLHNTEDAVFALRALKLVYTDTS